MDQPLDLAFDVDRPRKTRPGFRMSVRAMMVAVFVMSCIFAVATLCGRVVWSAREAARRAQCTCSLKQLALALHNYHSVYGCLPPAYVADASGKPMHSWRVLILPFLEQTPLYNRYDFSEPWNGPNNISLLNAKPQVFGCPSGPNPNNSVTNYFAITGPGTMFPGAVPIRFDDVADGPGRTLLVVEVANLAVPWTAPVDLDVSTMSFTVNANAPKLPSLSSPHPGGVNAAFGDGSCRFLRESMPASDVKAATTIAGGEVVHDDELAW